MTNSKFDRGFEHGFTTCCEFTGRFRLLQAHVQTVPLRPALLVPERIGRVGVTVSNRIVEESCMLGRSAPYLLAAVALACVAPRSWAGSSNSLMDISPDGAWLLVTNSDNGTVTVVDVAARRAVREIAVGDKPEGVCWIGGGPLAAVTVYRERLVVFFNAEDGQIVQKLTVADEPYGIVANKAGTKAWVTHEYPGLVSEIDLQQRAVLRASRVGAFLRGLALSPDESRLYVTEFYTAILHAVDLRPDGQLAGVDSWKGHTADNLCRQVVLHPRRPKAYLSHIRSKIERNDGNGSIFPHLSI